MLINLQNSQKLTTSNDEVKETISIIDLFNDRKGNIRFLNLVLFTASLHISYYLISRFTRQLDQKILEK